MEQRNNNQNSIIFEIETLLNKMSNQVNFLIRKDAPMCQLDIDLLMENTRKLYDTICSVELVAEPVEVTNEEWRMKNVEWRMKNEELDIKDDSRDVTTMASENVTTMASENVTTVASDELVTEPVEVPLVTEPVEVKNEECRMKNVELEDEDFSTEDENDDRADMIWDFTRDDEAVAEPVEVRNEEWRMKNEELEIEDDSRDVTTMASGSVTPVASGESVAEPVEATEEDSGIRVYKIVRDNVTTVGDVLEQATDNSLVARLQRKPIADLISAIGINDKFLFLNELFGGSMEKYNKSIRSLNSFSTLLGAKTYMSELQIEFQWDCESEAYKKLADLIERRFC